MLEFTKAAPVAMAFSSSVAFRKISIELVRSVRVGRKLELFLLVITVLILKVPSGERFSPYKVIKSATIELSLILRDPDSR